MTEATSTIQITYIDITETSRIEVMPSGNHYPQHLVKPAWRECSEGWSYWKTGTKQKHFKTEAGARKFLMQQSSQEPAMTQTCIHCQQRRPVTARVEHFLCDPCITELAAFEEMCELEALQQAWDTLQAVPAYVERTLA